MSSIGLPLELIQLILEVESLESQTWGSCALVCQAWLPFARRCLFYKMSLRGARDCIKLADVLKSSPNIAECVRVLSIDMGMTHSKPGPLLATGVAKVCSQLTHVQSIKLWNLPVRSLGSGHEEFFSSIYQIGKSARSLELVGVAFQREDQFCRLISAFLHISNLSLSFVGFDFSADTQKTIETHVIRPRLISLVTRSCHRRIFTLLHHVTTLELEHLSLMMSTGMTGMMDACFQDIEDLGSIDSMESLTLQYGSSSTIYGTCGVKDI